MDLGTFHLFFTKKKKKKKKKGGREEKENKTLQTLEQLLKFLKKHNHLKNRGGGEGSRGEQLCDIPLGKHEPSLLMEHSCQAYSITCGEARTDKQMVPHRNNNNKLHAVGPL